MKPPGTVARMPTIHLKAAAGGVGGSWYVLMAGLASLVAEVYPEIHIEVVAGGGVANHARVGAGEIPMGINLTLNYLVTFRRRGRPCGRWRRRATAEGCEGGMGDVDEGAA